MIDPLLERRRIAALERYRVLYTEAEVGFDALTQLVQTAIGTKISAITLLDDDFQFFKAQCGIGTRETPRDVAFCNYTIQSSEPLVVADATMDPRFCNNPLVTGDPHLRCYLGAPLRTPGGLHLGSVCVLDFEPRTFTSREVAIVRDAAVTAMEMLEMRRGLTETLSQPMAFQRQNWDRQVSEALHRGPCAVALAGCADLEEIAGAYGSKMADRMLSSIIDSATTFLPQGTQVARLNDSQVGLLLSHVSEAEALALVEAWRQSTETMVVDLGPSCSAACCVAVGLAVSHPNESPSNLMRRSHEALTAAVGLDLDTTVVADPAREMDLTSAA